MMFEGLQRAEVFWFVEIGASAQSKTRSMFRVPNIRNCCRSARMRNAKTGWGRGGTGRQVSVLRISPGVAGVDKLSVFGTLPIGRGFTKVSVFTILPAMSVFRPLPAADGVGHFSVSEMYQQRMGSASFLPSEMY